MQTFQRSEDVKGAARELEDAGLALEAFVRSGALARAELERLARTGEADLDRLARRLVALIAELAAVSLQGRNGPDRGGAVNVVMNLAEGGGGGAMSMNRASALIAQIARRGARFQ